jgi:hypothetical protein
MWRLRVSAQLGDNWGVRGGMRTTTIGVACVEVLAQPLVDRCSWLVRDEEVVGSNPATPTVRDSTSRPLSGGVFVILRLLIIGRRQRKGIKRS